jgi:hypothetical protein
VNSRWAAKTTCIAASLAIFASCVSVAACASAPISPSGVQARPHREALLILPGFGYNRAGEKALRALAGAMATEGIDLFVPTYISRAGLAKSRGTLQTFIRNQRLDQYERLHVFAFIAGAWTFNPLTDAQAPPNLATIVYDRSPYQERAPRVADEKLHFLTWLRYGSPVFDVARTPYAPLAIPSVKVGLVVETLPTKFVKGHEATVRSYGPIHFECDGFQQRHEDCLYLPMSHDEVYLRFATVWPEVLAFIRQGHFTSAANRTPPSGDPLGERRRR